METCKVKIVNLGNYVPGVIATMELKQAEEMAKAGSVKILSKESDKRAPEESNKKVGGKDGKDK